MALFPPRHISSPRIQVSGSGVQPIATVEGLEHADEVVLPQGPPDTTAPTCVVSSAAPNPVAGAFSVTITFSENVTGFTQADITVSNASKSGFSADSPSVYTCTITPSSSGTVQVSVAAGTCTDAAGNANEASNTLSRTADLTAPTVLLTSSASDPVNGAFSVNAEFSESVTGLGLDDILLAKASASNLTGSGANYSFTITPSSQGEVTVQIQAGAAQDAAGNANSASNVLSRTYDTVGPTCVVSGPAEAGMEYEVSIEFNEAVSGFTAEDITVTNGTVSDFSGSGASYSATITMDDDGGAIVQVPAGVCTDAAGNANSASNALETEYQEEPFEGPLDAVEELAAGYSFRRLLGSYSGPLIRVRRSSDNAEQDVGFDANGDLDTAALLAFAGEGDAFLVTRYDQTGGGAHVTQATTTLQPRIVDSGSLEALSSGRPAGRWDSSDDVLVSAETLTLEQPFVVISVIDGVSPSTNTRPWQAGSTHATVRTGDYQLNCGFNLRRGVPDGGLHVMTCVADGASSDIRLDTESLGAGNAGTGAGTGTFYEGNSNTIAVPLFGLLAETLVFAAIPDGLADIEAEMLAYYS